MITRFHTEAMKIINHQLKTRIKSLTEELEKDFPSLKRDEIMIMLAKSLSTYSYAMLVAIFKNNDFVSLITTMQTEQEHKHFKENPPWNQKSQNSLTSAILEELISKAFKDLKAGIPADNGS